MMILYILVISITTFLASVYSSGTVRYRNLFFMLLVFIPGVFMGIRGVGTDYIVHLNYYDSITYGDFYLVDYSSVLILIIKYLGTIGVPFQVSIFCISILTMYTAFKIIILNKEEVNVTYSVFIYMMTFYFLSFNLYRQILAINFFMLAISYWGKERNLKKYLLFGIISVAIHSTALIFLPVVILWNFITNKKYQGLRLFFYSTLVIIIFAIPYFAEKFVILAEYFPHYAYYFSNFIKPNPGLGILRYVVLVIIPSFYSVYMTKNDNIYEKKICYSMFFVILGTVLSLLSYISDSFLYRVSFYGLSAIPLFQGYLAKKYFNNNYGRIYMKQGGILIIMSIVTLVFFWYYDIFVLNTGEIYPFVFFWN